MNKELKMIAELPAPILANTLLPAVPLSETYHMDCIEGMKHYPDKYFDLAIVDPPYGIIKCMNGRRDDQYENIPPNYEYWIELFRVSKNQIVWGANYFTNFLPPSRGIIFWYKRQPVDDRSDGELAWTSFDRVAKLFDYAYTNVMEGKGGRKDKSIHPTQKPTGLYEWLLQNYADAGQKVLDTHLGSGSSRIAAHKNGFDFVGFEIDKIFFDKQEKRFANYVCQPRLF